MVLEVIRQPSDLRGLTTTELEQLAAEIRDFIVAAVSETGGHLGSNLGAVELTLALHRVTPSCGTQDIRPTFTKLLRVGAGALANCAKQVAFLDIQVVKKVCMTSSKIVMHQLCSVMHTVLPLRAMPAKHQIAGTSLL